MSQKNKVLVMDKTVFPAIGFAMFLLELTAGQANQLLENEMVASVSHNASVT